MMTHQTNHLSGWIFSGIPFSRHLFSCTMARNHWGTEFMTYTEYLAHHEPFIRPNQDISLAVGEALGTGRLCGNMLVTLVQLF